MSPVVDEQVSVLDFEGKERVFSADVHARLAELDAGIRDMERNLQDPSLMREEAIEYQRELNWLNEQKAECESIIQQEQDQGLKP